MLKMIHDIFVNKSSKLTSVAIPTEVNLKNNVGPSTFDVE